MFGNWRFVAARPATGACTLDDNYSRRLASSWCANPIRRFIVLLFPQIGQQLVRKPYQTVHRAAASADDAARSLVTARHWRAARLCCCMVRRTRPSRQGAHVTETGAYRCLAGGRSDPSCFDTKDLAECGFL